MPRFICAAIIGLMVLLVGPAYADDRDWTQIVATTPEGGFVMGNPDADLKLVEFVSMSCPHCATFDAEAHDRLIDDVKSGQLSYEIRNMVRDPFDSTAALVARCGGPERFFPLTHRLLANQEEWIGKLTAMPQQDLDSLQAMAPEEQYQTIASWAGFAQYAAAEGLDIDAMDACLMDPSGTEQLNQIYSMAMETYAIQGVPAFLINGELASGSTWAELEPQLETDGDQQELTLKNDQPAAF